MCFVSVTFTGNNSSALFHNSKYKANIFILFNDICSRKDRAVVLDDVGMCIFFVETIDAALIRISLSKSTNIYDNKNYFIAGVAFNVSV